MGILDGIVEWIAERVMNGLDLINTSVLGALGCNMSTFNRYFPAAETMYKIFVALAIGLILLNWVWQLFKNYGLSAGIEAGDPVTFHPFNTLYSPCLLCGRDRKYHTENRRNTLSVDTQFRITAA